MNIPFLLRRENRRVVKWGRLLFWLLLLCLLGAVGGMLFCIVVEQGSNQQVGEPLVPVIAFIIATLVVGTAIPLRRAWRRPLAELPSQDPAPRMVVRLEQGIGWFVGWHKIRRNLFCLAALVTLIGLGYAVENWRARRAWNAYRQGMAAQGEFLELDHFIPTPVPENQNFALTPMLKPLLDYEVDGSGRTLNWRDTNAYQRVWNVSLTGRPGAQTAPATMLWDKGERLKLAEWQIFFRGTNYASTRRYVWRPASSGSTGSNTHVLSRPGTRQPAHLGTNSAPTPGAGTNDPAGPSPEAEPETPSFWPRTKAAQSPAADIVLALTKFAPEIAELQQAAKLPHSRFPIHYEQVEGALLPHLAVIRQVAAMLDLRAVAELELGQSPAALADVESALRLADTIQSDATSISQLVRLRIIQESLQPVWEGLAEHRWSAVELARLDAALRGFDLLADYGRTARVEAAFVNAWLDHCKREREAFATMAQFNTANQGVISPLWNFLLPYLPAGVFDENKLFASRAMYERILPFVQAGERRAYPALVRTNAAFLASQVRHENWVCVAVGGFVIAPAQFAHAQTDLDLARIAGALELHYQATGDYPLELAALSPKFMNLIPTDIITGKPLHYQRTKDGGFTLYSVGWDEKDDGGAVVKYDPEGHYAFPYRQMSDRPETGDWVWRSPAPKP